MSEDDLRAGLRDLARPLRELALDLDRDPGAITAALDLPAVRLLAVLGVSEAHGNPAAPIGGHRVTGTTAAERVVVMEEFARADAGALVASPGPLLAGVVLAGFGDERQQRRGYERMVAEPTWTCFALTEPDTGSAAGDLATSATDGRIVGRKRYVGNAARAGLGVVFARCAPGPLGVRAYLLDLPAPGFRAVPLPMLGLRGAQICAVDLEGVPVTDADVLGAHLPRSRRGVLAFVHTFNQLRPGVAAIAVGIALAACDEVRAGRRRLGAEEQERLDDLLDRAAGARRLVAAAARAVDADPADGALASAAKAHASRLAVDATRAALGFFGTGARLEHPLLDKLFRDAKSLEFIEGTTHMQLLNVARGLSSPAARDTASPASPVPAAIPSVPRPSGVTHV